MSHDRSGNVAAVYEDGIHEDFEALAFASVGALPPLAIANPRLARSVHVPRSAREIPKGLARCTRVMRIEGDESKITALPAWLAKLERLEELSFEAARGLATVPPAIFALPRLRQLGLAFTKVASLDGLARSSTLEHVSIEGTPVAKDSAKLDALLARLPKGTKLVRETIGPDLTKGLVIQIPRRPADDRVRPAAGRTFDGICLAEQTLLRANLRGTTWKECELGRMRGPKSWSAPKKGPAGFDGANLEGAIFEDCIFVGTTFRKAKLRGAKFRRCRFFSDVIFEESDLRDAELDLLDDPSVQIRKTNAAGMSFTAAFSEPSYSRTVAMRDVDLSDASVLFRLAEGKRSPSKKATWDATIKGGKRSPGTTIAFGELPKPASISLDGVKPAPAIGRFAADNASLWGIVADPTVTASWKGDEGYDHDSQRPGGGVSSKNRATDFGRAMDLGEGTLAIGGEKAVLVTVGGCGVSEIWRIENGLALLAHFPADDFDGRGKKGVVELGKRVVGLPAAGKSRRLGRVEVRSGCLAFVLPYLKGEARPPDVRTAAKATKVTPDGLVLVPLANGSYDVFKEAIDHEDELGSYEARVRVVRV
jgi:uncharacterized protein YjbI with pentapeptide repeats